MFLTACKTARKFTRYLNIQVNLQNIAFEDLKSDQEADKITKKIIQINKDLLGLKVSAQIVSEENMEYKDRNLFSNVIREKLDNSENWIEILKESGENCSSIIFIV